MPTSITSSIGGRKSSKSSKSAATKSTGGYNLAPLVSALLLAGIKLSLEQNKKLADKRKASASKQKTKAKSMPRPNTV